MLIRLERYLQYCRYDQAFCYVKIEGTDERKYIKHIEESVIKYFI